MLNELFSLAGKIALVTGSSRGIGFTLARGLARAGATIILNGRDETKLNLARQSLKAEGIDARISVFDVCNAPMIEEQLEVLTREVGEVGILVNNAGIQIRGPLEYFEEQNWRKLLDTNLTGVFLTSKAVVQGMIKRKSGKIVNICSVQSTLARPSIAPYAATKGGLKMLTQAMAAEWGKHNIQVNGLAPGYLKTEMTRALFEDDKFNSWLCSRTPANRWGEPDELVGPLVFLASSASNYVNGHMLQVDGGLIACV